MKQIFIVTLFLSLFITTSSWSGTIELSRTGQIWSYDTNSPQRDDGAIQAGVPWPDPRFATMAVNYES